MDSMRSDELDHYKYHMASRPVNLHILTTYTIDYMLNNFQSYEYGEMSLNLAHIRFI